MKKLTKVIACIVVVLFALMLMLVCCGEDKNVLEWPDRGLALLLPQPETENGEVNYSDARSFSANIENISLNDYNVYVDQCVAYGFAIEAEETDHSYEAYNQDGYELRLYYNEYSQYYSVYLTIPRANGTLSWPTRGLATLVPSPDSQIGNIETDSTETFSVYVGDMDIFAYQSYVEECIDAGFNIDYNKGEKSFSAKNSDGIKLQVRYEGFRTIYIYVHEEPVASNTASISETTSVSESTSMNFDSEETTKREEPIATSENTFNVIRPEFKAMLESYEAFFDEYIEILQKYEANPNDMTLLMEYVDYTARYADVMEKLYALGDEEMNEVELLYYLEVQARISQKIIDATQ